MLQAGEHGSPLQFNNDIVVFIKQVELQILYRYFWVSDECPYFKPKKSAGQFNLRTVLPTYLFTYLHFFKK